MPYRRIHLTFVLSLLIGRFVSIMDELELVSNENLTRQLGRHPTKAESMMFKYHHLFILTFNFLRALNLRSSSTVSGKCFRNANFSRSLNRRRNEMLREKKI